jgi:hypothetical protein
MQRDERSNEMTAGTAIRLLASALAFAAGAVAIVTGILLVRSAV